MHNKEWNVIENKLKEILKESTWDQNEWNIKMESGDQFDQSSQLKEFDMKAKLKGRNFRYLRKVKDALRRMDKGEYGCCLDCGAEISKERLLARPTAELCISCKEEKEVFESKCFDQKKQGLRYRGTVVSIAC